MGTTGHEHNAADLRRQLFWTARLERFVQHLFLALLAFGLLPKGSDQKRGVETMLDILETWLTGYTRQGPPGQRDTLPEGDMAAMRAELDRQTEATALAMTQRDEARMELKAIASELSGVAADKPLHAARYAASAWLAQVATRESIGVPPGSNLPEILMDVQRRLATVHGIEPAALALPELVQRTIDVIAARTNARTILAEQDALRYRAELHTAQRELATERETWQRDRKELDRLRIGWPLHRVHEICNRVGAPVGDLVHKAEWMASHIRDCERIINGCRAAFGKKPMGADGEEYMDLVADVTAAAQACNRGPTKDVSRDLAVIIGRTCDTLQIAKGAPIVERAEALEAFATYDGALVQLPKPEKIETGQRWARVMTVRSLDYERNPIDENGSAWSASRMKADDDWIYLGPAKEGAA